MSKHLRWALPALLASPLVVFLLLIGLVLIVLEDDEAQAGQPCGAGGTSVTVDAAGVPTELTAGGATYRSEQLGNAAAILKAGADLGVSAHGQTIGVMTAIGESTLFVLDRGDAVGPDSRGLFQQRDNGAWGSYSDRMDPYISSTNFFRALLAVPGWETLAPTIAAHRTQHNADPYHYERFWDDAQVIVAALAGVDVSLLPVSTGSGGVPCTDVPGGQGVVVPAGTWVRPSTGPVTSGFGPRWGKNHNGLDFGAPCGTPTLAAKDGVVVGVHKNNRSPATGYGTLIVIDHGGGIVTRYAHAPNDGILVTIGEPVMGGQQISEIGTYGNSTGCHLHFEVQQGGAFVDPAPVLTGNGVVL
jgi:hypothetical protein